MPYIRSRREMGHRHWFAIPDDLELPEGTTASRVFVVRFVSDGTNLYEASRTVAMVA